MSSPAAEISAQSRVRARSPLEGVRVLELARFVAGPSAGSALAHLGADVIRVDPPGGAADYRRWPLAGNGTSLYWTGLNRGTRSVVIDTRHPDGRALVADLAARVGIVLDNAPETGWLRYADIAANRPDLIRVQILGRHDGAAAVDYTVNAGVGVAHMTGPEDDARPLNHVLPAWDLLAGAMAATSLLAALHRRVATGEGAHVRIALEDVATWALGALGWLAEADVSGDRPRLGNSVNGSFGIDLPTADGGRVMVVALTARQWRALCEATGTVEVFDAIERALDTDFEDDGERFLRREVIAGVLRPWFTARSRDEVATILDRHSVLWGPFRTVTEMLRDYAADPVQDAVVEIDQPDVGPMLTAASPMRWDDLVTSALSCPRLGADTYSVLVDVLGVTDCRIERLCEAGVIQVPDRPET